jgi:ABC-type protease/lipase transport system fused ATPase/permease subunit
VPERDALASPASCACLSSLLNPRDRRPDTPPPAEGSPFSVGPLTLRAPAGALVGIVGAVGSGKSTLGVGLLGELRGRDAAAIGDGGPVGYLDQSPAVINGSISSGR